MSDEASGWKEVTGTRGSDLPRQLRHTQVMMATRPRRSSRPHCPSRRWDGEKDVVVGMDLGPDMDAHLNINDVMDDVPSVTSTLARHAYYDGHDGNRDSDSDCDCDCDCDCDSDSDSDIDGGGGGSDVHDSESEDEVALVAAKRPRVTASERMRRNRVSASRHRHRVRWDVHNAQMTAAEAMRDAAFWHEYAATLHAKASDGTAFPATLANVCARRLL